VRTRHQSGVASLTWFLDRNLGRHVVADALRQAGVDVEVHDDHFRRDAEDEEWLREVGRRGWVVLTRDRRIRYRSHERAALIQAGVRAFVLVAGNLSGREMAAVFVKALPAMRRFMVRHPPPFIAKVTRSGAVSLLVGTEDER
jgi:predicted nuclease of predicted toxin-antitoxin system